jgi:FkbH-like protein
MSFLPWLPQHQDFGGALRAARTLPGAADRVAAAVALAGYDRDAVQAGRLDRVAADGLAEVGTEGAAAAGHVPLRLAILSSHSVDHLVPSMRVAGLGRRVALSVHVGVYGQYRQALLLGDPELAAFAPQMVLLALDSQALVPALPVTASAEEAAEAMGRAVEDLRHLWRLCRERYGAQPLQQTVIPQTPSVFGSYDGLAPASPAALCADLNAHIRKAAREDGVLLLDVAWQLPLEAQGAPLFDPVRWHHAKQLINPLFAPLYGELVARVASAVVGTARKCLILDLDNTMWGGVVGDDGVEGLKLGQGSAEGEAYLAFQQYVAALAQRGVILAVCSKNDEAVARAVFDTHPDMVLACRDIACFLANWTDKATNIREIARRLNIGLDSLVFVDDNPAEREIVRRELPQVAAPELPEDSAYYAARLAAAGYFETVSLTVEDLKRNQSYAMNAERAALLDAATDMTGFLRSLEMRMTTRSLLDGDRQRAAQLVNKSNQFNLTTRRRTEQELTEVGAAPGTIGLTFRLSDRFGDNGLISVLVARPDEAWPDATLLIDTWVMSCRVLGRGVEDAALSALVAAAAGQGVEALIGEYRPSGRNGMVQDHYAKLGFTEVAPPPNAEANARFWRLSVAEAPAPTHHIQMETTP